MGIVLHILVMGVSLGFFMSVRKVGIAGAVFDRLECVRACFYALTGTAFLASFHMESLLCGILFAYSNKK